jgi:hypothetical protein
MQRFFQRRLKAAATGGGTERDPPGRSLVAASSSTKTFPSGIKLLYGPADAVIECVQSSSSQYHMAG